MFTAQDGTIVGVSWNELGIDVPTGRTSGQWKSHCPKCHSARKNQTDRSLSINLNEMVANCKNIGCEQKYAIDRYKNASNFVSATKNFKEKTYVLPKPMTEYTGVNAKTAAWFKDKRGISLDTLKRAKVTSGIEFMPQVDAKVNTVQFNYFDEKGVLANIKYRDGKKNFRMYGGAKLIFYNVACLLEPKNSVVIVEGEIDALSCMEAGIGNVISVPNGAQIGNNNMEYLNHHWHLFDDKWRKDNNLPALTKIVLAVDADAAGKALRDEFIRRFGSARCYFVNFKDCKDANEYLIDTDALSLFNAINMAVPAPLNDVIMVNDLMDELGEMHRTGLNAGLQVGTDNFMKHYSFEPARLTIITGIPTHGKSEFLDDIMARMAVEHGWRFAIFSPENFPIVLHIAKLVSKITGKDFNSCSGVELEQAYQFINAHFFWIYPKDDNYTLKNICHICDSLVERYGVNSLIIDPWTEVDDEGKNDTDGVKNRLTEVNRYKRKQNLHIFLVAHPTKMQKDDTGKMIVPDLSNISGSAHYYNKTDGGLTVYRDFDSGIVQVYVNKVKFKHLGKIGVVSYHYNVRNGRYENVKTASEPWDDANWLNQPEQMALEMQPNRNFDEDKPPTREVFVPSPEDQSDLPF